MKRTTVLMTSALSWLALVLAFQNCSGGFKGAGEGSPLLSSTSTNTPIDPTTQGKVQVFMAAGKMGRTVMSCDGGATWINDRSDDDAARCWLTGDPHYVECDHSAYSFTGLDAGDGAFYMQDGWGYNGNLRKSTDGKNWSVIRSGGWGGGVVYYDHSVLSIFEGNWGLSTDSGQTFSHVTAGNYDHGFIQRAGSTFLMFGRPDSKQILGVSSDQGQTWSYPANYLAQWGGRFAEGNGRLVSAGTFDHTSGEIEGYIAISTDQGLTWTAQKVFDASNGHWSGPLLFDGSQFVIWYNGMTWTSPDAVTWSQTKTVDIHGNRPWSSAAVAYNSATKTYAAIDTGWTQWYDQQHAYGSPDGIHWTALDAVHYKGGHPIGGMMTSEIAASACQ